MSFLTGRGIAEIAHWMGLVPLTWLAIEGARGQSRAAVWWWLAGAFGVSWVADTAAHFIPQADSPAITVIYPVSQAAIIGAVLLSRRLAKVALWLLAALALIAILWNDAGQQDLLVRAAAWLLVVGIVWYRDDLPYRLRFCLLVYFGVGLAMWMVHLRWLTVATWYPYQAARLAGLVLFCWAASASTSTLRAET
jgi:hypothetical protein